MRLAAFPVVPFSKLVLGPIIPWLFRHAYMPFSRYMEVGIIFSSFTVWAILGAGTSRLLTKGVAPFCVQLLFRVLKEGTHAFGPQLSS
jgi:hypothetical protein